MTTKWTAGPWAYFIGNADGRGLIRIEAAHDSAEAGRHISSLPRGKVSEANARLLAASPDLAEALADYVDQTTRYINYPDTTPLPDAAQARAALKAAGWEG